MHECLGHGDSPLSIAPHVRRRLEEASSASIEEGVSLKRYTSFHIGGPAALFAAAEDTETVAALLAAARAEGVPVLILGGGTNLLIDDRGFEGLALHLNLRRCTIDTEDGRVEVQAAVPTAALVAQTVESGLAGTAFAAGLPGSVGGGLAGNAGCFGKCLGDLLESATVVSPAGEISQIEGAAWFRFGYRRSRLLESGWVLTEARFALPKGEKARLQEEADANIALRRQKHPLPGSYTAGSFFKNLPPPSPGEHRVAAGLLLDRAGARELSVGDAAVFERHANIVINRGNATCADILSLTDAMRARVRDRFGVLLEQEVRYISPVGETGRS